MLQISRILREVVSGNPFFVSLDIARNVTMSKETKKDWERKTDLCFNFFFKIVAKGTPKLLKLTAFVNLWNV